MCFGENMGLESKCGKFYISKNLQKSSINISKNLRDSLKPLPVKILYQSISLNRNIITVEPLEKMSTLETTQTLSAHL